MENDHGYVYTAIKNMGFFGMLFLVITGPFIGASLLAWYIWKVCRRKFASKSVTSNASNLLSKPITEQVIWRFLKYGYHVEQISPGSCDLYINKPGEFGIVRCKKYDGPIGEQQLRGLFEIMQQEGADSGYFVTTGYFTTEGYAWAKGKKIVPIDGDALYKMLRETGA